MPIRDIPALVAAIKQALAPAEQAQAFAQSRADFRELARAELHQRLFLPRVGSGVFAAACGFLLTFGDKFKDDPLMGLWVQGRTGRLAIFTTMLYSAVLFVMTWWMEQTEAAKTEWLATEGGRRHVFAMLFELRGGHPNQEDREALRFSFSNLLHAIRGPRRRMLPLPFFGRGLSVAAAEKLARAHLGELEARGVVRKILGGRLDLVYEMDRGAADEIRRGGDR